MAAILEIYLVRHAIAAERGPKYPDDRKRPLTSDGIKRFKESVRGLVAMDVELDVILTSPLTRAEETATLLAEGFKKRVPVDTVEALAPGGKFVLVLRLQGKRSKAPNPLSRNGDEVSAACKALQDAGFVIQAMRGISRTSHGIVATPAL